MMRGKKNLNFQVKAGAPYNLRIDLTMTDDPRLIGGESDDVSGPG